MTNEHGSIDETLSDEEVQKKWAVLANAVAGILDGNAPSMSYEDLYRFGYQLVQSGKGKFLYENVETAVKEYLDQAANKFSETQDSQMLTEMKDFWDNYQTRLRVIADVFFYLDRRNDLVSEGKGIPIFVMGIEVFRESFLQSVSKRLIESIFAEIQKERLHSGSMNRPLIRDLLSMLSQCDPDVAYCKARASTTELAVIMKSLKAKDLKCLGQFYVKEFETRFLEETATFYKKESEKARQGSTEEQISKKAEASREYESALAKEVIPTQTGKALMNCVTTAWAPEPVGETPPTKSEA